MRLNSSLLCWTLVFAFSEAAVCNIRKNTDRPGGDYALQRTNSVDKCAQACSADDKCVTAQYRKENGYCYLKNRAGNATPSDNTDTVDCRVDPGPGPGPDKPKPSNSMPQTTETTLVTTYRSSSSTTLSSSIKTSSNSPSTMRVISSTALSTPATTKSTITTSSGPASEASKTTSQSKSSTTSSSTPSVQLSSSTIQSTTAAAPTSTRTVAETSSSSPSPTSSNAVPSTTSETTPPTSVSTVTSVTSSPITTTLITTTSASSSTETESLTTTSSIELLPTGTCDILPTSGDPDYCPTDGQSYGGRNYITQDRTRYVSLTCPVAFYDQQSFFLATVTASSAFACYATCMQTTDCATVQYNVSGECKLFYYYDSQQAGGRDGSVILKLIGPGRQPPSCAYPDEE